MTRLLGIKEEKRGPRDYEIINVWIRRIDTEFHEDDVSSGMVKVDVFVDCWQEYSFKTFLGKRKTGFGHLNTGKVIIKTGIMGKPAVIEKTVRIIEGYAITTLLVPRHPRKSTYITARIIGPRKSEWTWRTV
jgi:hypothetical protein